VGHRKLTPLNLSELGWLVPLKLSRGPTPRRIRAATRLSRRGPRTPESAPHPNYFLFP